MRGSGSNHLGQPVKQWLLAHPGSHLHLTPRSSSWLHLVERWFAELTQEKLKHGVHRSVQALERDIRSRLANWNEDPRARAVSVFGEYVLARVATCSLLVV